MKFEQINLNLGDPRKKTPEQIAEENRPKLEMTPEIYEEIMVAADRLQAKIENEKTEGVEHKHNESQVYAISIMTFAFEIAVRLDVSGKDIYDFIYQELVRRGKIKDEEVIK